LGPEPTPKEFGDVGAGSSASLDATGGPLPSDAEAGASGAPAFDFHSLVDLSHPLSLGEVVEAVECVLNHPRATALPTMQVIKDILMAYDMDAGDWRRYRLLDPKKNYTRNLIASDDRTYSLILLCWNPRKFSPIHDHPCNGCWLRCVEGCIEEVRYGSTACASGCLPVTLDTMVSTGEVAYLNDSMGLHKVGNPTDEVAVTLHLYSPPYSSCRIWLDPSNPADVQRPVITFHSMFGELTEY